MADLLGWHWMEVLFGPNKTTSSNEKGTVPRKRFNVDAVTCRLHLLLFDSIDKVWLVGWSFHQRGWSDRWNKCTPCCGRLNADQVKSSLAVHFELPLTFVFQPRWLIQNPGNRKTVETLPTCLTRSSGVTNSTTTAVRRNARSTIEASDVTQSCKEQRPSHKLKLFWRHFETETEWHKHRSTCFARSCNSFDDARVHCGRFRTQQHSTTDNLPKTQFPI